MLQPLNEVLFHIKVLSKKNKMTISSITFYLNNKKRIISFEKESNLTPLTTVLEYLRDYEHLMGTKEGCGVGDCGACTVCIAQKDKSIDKVVFYALNSCLLLLPMLNGKHLFTIEGIAKNGQLHPIQSALIEKRGIQCGFCSPGMVMSAYAHYRNALPFSREEIEKTLSGNLCRCTGYESILEAMLSLSDIDYKNEELPHFDDELIKVGNCDIEYSWDGYSYFKLSELKKVLELKSKYRSAIIVSGGTDMSIMLKHNKISSGIIIDISDIDQLKSCENTKDYLYIGGNVSIETFKNILSPYYPNVDKYLSSFASKQVRNKATISGSISGSSPVGDIMPLILALDAEIVLISQNNKREIESSLFITSYRKNEMHNDEIIGGVIIRKPKKEGFLFCHKQSKRKDMDISTMTCCIYFETNKGKISTFYTGFGGMAAIPKGSCSAEEFLIGKEVTLENFQRGGVIARGDFSPISDVRGSAENRLQLVENLFIKCFNDYESSR